MADRNYPAALSEVEAWSRAQRVSTEQGRVRFAEFVILNCIASQAITRQGLIFKGGNALRFAYHSPRSTKDIDFTADSSQFPVEPEQLRGVLNDALKFAERRFNLKAKCQRIKRNPNRPGATHPTYDIAVGYQMPEDRYFHNFESRAAVPTIIPLEISVNDLVCETRAWADVQGLRVCSLEDILAEKLRALLQQKIRKRNRWQDVYDICTIMRRHEFDREKVADYLLQKSSIRGIVPTKSGFDAEVRDRAASDYEQRVRTEAPRDLIPFDEAWKAVEELVNLLEIPA